MSKAEQPILRSHPAFVEEDLTRIVQAAQTEFAAMSGHALFLTGGAGFLGYYLTLAPLYWNRMNPSADPIQVINTDIFKSGRPFWMQFIDSSDLQILKYDCRDPVPDIKAAFIIHAASIASPTFYRQFPIETIQANVDGLTNVLEWAKHRTSVASILFLSSNEIYGDPPPDKVPTDENYRGNVSCTGPRACYDESKRLCETLCTCYVRKYGTPVKIIRPFNNFGPGLSVRDGRAMADFAYSVIYDRDIEILSDGRPTRTFCYVSDAVTGYFKALAIGRNGEPYNIGTREPEISMKELALLTAEVGRELFGYGGEVTFQQSNDEDYLTDSPNRRCPNIDKANQELNYEPLVDLRKGIGNYLLWAKWASEHE